VGGGAPAGKWARARRGLKCIGGGSKTFLGMGTRTTRNVFFLIVSGAPLLASPLKAPEEKVISEWATFEHWRTTCPPREVGAGCKVIEAAGVKLCLRGEDLRQKTGWGNLKDGATGGPLREDYDTDAK